MAGAVHNMRLNRSVGPYEIRAEHLWLWLREAM